MVDTRVGGFKDGNDFFPTNPRATTLFMDRLVRDVGSLQECVCIEPACGNGAMSDVLKSYFWYVYSSDIDHYGYSGQSGQGNFMDKSSRNSLYKGSGAGWLITNPPFNRAEEFIKGGMDLEIPNMAFLVRIQFAESLGRYERLFKDNPPTDIYLHVCRIPFEYGKISTDSARCRMTFGWFCWIKGNKPTQMHWLPGKIV